MADDEADVTLKFVLVGDSGVGKSNVIRRFVSNSYDKASKQTVGLEFSSKVLLARSSGRVVRVRAQIWDTAGQERFQSLTSAFFKGAVGVLVVYDISRRSSFDAVPRWLEQARANTHGHTVMTLVGHKSDLARVTGARQVSTLEAARFAQEHQMGFFEASALEGTNVSNAFRRVIMTVALMVPAAPGVGVPDDQADAVPEGWVIVPSRSRPGQVSFENMWTGERVATKPQESAAVREHNVAYALPAEVVLPTVTSLRLEAAAPGARSAPSASSNRRLAGTCGCVIL